eukprot:TRINITY_DN76684_c0_g1_i1.p1 TRINITY_DN76684_c0_g1~~TRINITY_DN76684_c0_g1_i1.p1  ORF type:complete len:447 (-),score=56.79 TRINITY_DN76684_c0_g1_i1:72-1412(-)
METLEASKPPQTPQRCSLAPTPLRQRSPGTAAPTVACPTPRIWPDEARGLCWPFSFCDVPHGERLELTQDASTATRTSGVTKGIAFVGPLKLEKGVAYFEIEVTELEPRGTQSMAIGMCCSLPSSAGKGIIRTERARELGEGCCMLGYDLPKIYADGKEVGKINAKQWRPLKELVVGSRVGLLIDRESMQLSVFVNGVKKVTSTFSTGTDGARWPSDVWGVVDVHGTVRSVRLLQHSDGEHRQEAKLVVPPPPPRWVSPEDETAALPRLASTQDLGLSASPPCTVEAPINDGEKAQQVTVPGFVTEDPCPGPRKPTAREVTAGPKKRIRLTVHPCGCLVHLVNSASQVIHVPRLGDFVIGRNPKSCNLTLDSSEVPNMISRRHAVIVSADDSVMVVDCESLNGTFVNGRRVGRETLRQGDLVVVGNPAQSPPNFRFEVSMPSAPER